MRTIKIFTEIFGCYEISDVFARGILFVEGISEAILIPEMAKALDRPLEKYAVELVNVDSVAFKPFVNLFHQNK